ncbi:MAG: cupin domain-containing protein, partial [Bacillota bacterium]
MDRLPAGGKVQEAEWGSFTWVREPRDPEKGRLSMARIAFRPGAHQAPHSHCSEEQILYVVSGEGTSVFNGESTHLVPGTVRHMPASGTHEVFASQSGLELLIVYAPAPLRLPSVTTESYPLDPAMLRAAVDSPVIAGHIRRVASLLDLGLVFADSAGGMLGEPVNAPPDCLVRCFSRSRGPWNGLKTPESETIFECCHENHFVAVAMSRLVGPDSRCAYLFAGPVNLGRQRNVPRSRLYAVAETVHMLAYLIEMVTRQKEIEIAMTRQILSDGAFPKTGAAGLGVRNRGVAEAIDLIHRNLQTRTRLTDAARAAGLNPAHLSRVFHKET